jgi:hypothetical protein
MVSTRLVERSHRMLGTYTCRSLAKSFDTRSAFVASCRTGEDTGKESEDQAKREEVYIVYVM